MKRLISRLRRRGGFSLAELLAAVAVLSLLTAMGAVGIHTAIRERDLSIRLANAQTLGSDVMEIISHELRYGRNITPGDNSVTLDSASYGEGAVIGLSSGGRLQVTVGGKEYPLLGGAAYTSFQPGGNLAAASHCVLKLAELKIEKTDSSHATIYFEVKDADDGTTVLWKTPMGVTVELLNVR